MDAFRSKAFWAKAVYVVPFAFAAGLWLRDELNASSEEEKVVEMRVQKALGEWKPPALTAKQRETLEAERDALQAEIKAIRERLARQANRPS